MNKIIQTKSLGFFHNRISILLLILTFILIVSAQLLLIFGPPIQGYEISIYDKYSPFFWFLLITSIILSVSLSIIFHRKSKKNWIYSFFGIIIINSIIFFFPMIRGYKFYALGGGDIFAHIAWSLYVDNTGIIKANDHYPAIHIIISTIHQFTCLDPIIVSYILSYLIFNIYIVSICILGKKLFNSTKIFPVFALFSSPLIFSFIHHSLYPYFFGLLFIPLIIYLIINTQSGNFKYYSILLIILSLFEVICHPLVAIYVMIVIIVFFFNSLQFSRSSSLLVSLIIIITGFLSWYLNFGSILNMGKIVIRSIIGEEINTIFSYNLELVNQLEISTYQLSTYIIKLYGPIIVYFGFAAIIAILFISKKIYRKECLRFIPFLLLFLLSTSILFLMIYNNLIIFEIIRASAFTIIISTIIISIGFCCFFKAKTSSHARNFYSSIIILILCFVIIISIFNIYPSPITMSPSWHMSSMEIDGLNWFLMNINQESVLA